jgi:hypothetical protein
MFIPRLNQERLHVLRRNATSEGELTEHLIIAYWKMRDELVD